jgi:putative restriction endonuclease
MPIYAAITENDISEWEDEPGVRYHFPKRYAKFLPPGAKVVYYKGRLKDKAFAHSRLSSEPHYFAFADIGTVYPDAKSTKGDLFANIENYQHLSRPVLAKLDGAYLEPIPEAQVSNYWRNGVRPISQDTYNLIRTTAELPPPESINDENQGAPAALESGYEGSRKVRFVTQYERDPALRAAAVAIHGVTCCVCGFNFGQFYGSVGEGFIHIHHLLPVSASGGPIKVSPKSDMAPVCANCHAIIHRKRDNTLTVEQLRRMVGEQRGER